MTWIAGVAQGASDITTTSMNAFIQKEANERSREFNREMADLAWEREKEMWNMQNQYNSPSAQMERFKNAGLNPHLIYGQGTAGNATTYPKYQAPQGAFGLPKIERLNVLDAYNDIRMKNAQVDLVNQQKQNMIASTRINKAKAIMAEGTAKIVDQKIQNELNRIAFQNDSFKYDLDAKKLNVSKLGAEIGRIAQQMDLTELEKQRLQRWLDAMEMGVNIDRDPWYIRVIERIITDMKENGLSDWGTDVF